MYAFSIYTNICPFPRVCLLSTSEDAMWSDNGAVLLSMLGVMLRVVGRCDGAR